MKTTDMINILIEEKTWLYHLMRVIANATTRP